MIKGEVRTFGEAEAGDRRPSSRCVEVSATTFAAEGITVGERRQQKQQQSQEPPQLSPKTFPSYLRSPLLGDADADASRYDIVLQGKINSAASAAGGVLSTTHPQRNEGNVTGVTCGMRILSPLRFIRRTSPSKQKLQRGKG